ncbi:hypothetical protein KKHLCK_06395 [Candidatus Electrothrix laxa]
MTLVAAFSANGIPALIGDIALTRDAIRSLRKKAYIITQNLAIAWTGHAIVAKLVVSEMREAFSALHPTKVDVERFFTRYQVEDFGALHTNFIGWLVDDEAHCFRWNCLFPNEVFYETSFTDGSGEEYLKNLRREREQWEKGGSGLPSEEQTVLSLINEVAHARFRETLDKNTWDISFGGSYDIIVYLAGRFRYVRSVIYIGWDYHWNSNTGTGKLQQAPLLIKHNCMGEFSVIQEALHGSYYNGKTTNYLSRPVYDNMDQADLSQFPLTIDSDYYANYFIFRENGKVPFKILLTVQKITKEGPLRMKRKDGAYFLHYDTNLLDDIYRKHTTAC